MDSKALTYNTNIIDWSNPVTKGLVGAFRLNEGAGKMAFDATRFTLPGTLTNDAVYKVSPIGSGCSFDGTTDYITFGTNFKKFDNKSTITISCIIRANSYRAGGFDGIFSRWSGAAVTTGIWGLSLYQGKIYLLVYNQTNWNNGYCYNVSDSAITTGKSYHIVVTWNGTNNDMSMFVNSVRQVAATVTSGTTATTILNTSISTRISTFEESGGANTNSFDGAIKELLIWDRIVTPTEARQLHVDSNNIYL